MFKNLRGDSKSFLPLHDFAKVLCSKDTKTRGNFDNNNIFIIKKYMSSLVIYKNCSIDCRDGASAHFSAVACDFLNVTH